MDAKAFLPLHRLCTAPWAEGGGAPEPHIEVLRAGAAEAPPAVRKRPVPAAADSGRAVAYRSSAGEGGVPWLPGQIEPPSTESRKPPGHPGNLGVPPKCARTPRIKQIDVAG